MTYRDMTDSEFRKAETRRLLRLNDLEGLQKVADLDPSQGFEALFRLAACGTKLGFGLDLEKGEWEVTHPINIPGQPLRKDELIKFICSEIRLILNLIGDEMPSKTSKVKDALELTERFLSGDKRDMGRLSRLCQGCAVEMLDFVNPLPDIIEYTLCVGSHLYPLMRTRGVGTHFATPLLKVMQTLKILQGEEAALQFRFRFIQAMSP